MGKLEIKDGSKPEITDGAKDDMTPMMKDAFIALTTALMKEFFVSSTSKYFIFEGMLSNLEKMGYSEEMMNKFKERLKIVLDSHMETNDFMG